MLLKQLTKLSRLHKTELRSIRNLVDICEQGDGFRIKLYWNILQNRITQELNDILYYVDGNLVGYLALFTFEVDEAEISIVVHPKYRRQGIGKLLLREGLLELNQRRIPKTLWICPRGSRMDENYMQALHAEYDFSQIEMFTTQIPNIPNLPEIQLRQAVVEDLPLIAKIGMVGFDSTYHETLQRFSENMQEKNRKIWLLSTPECANIGKIHVRFDDDATAFIHDLCVLPDYRGRKLAVAMTLKMMAMLRQEGWKLFTLDVETDNESAIKLYLQCGFRSVVTYDYWHVPAAVVAQLCQTLR